MRVDPPVTLPAGLRSLSVSSVALYLKCPLRWKRRYIDLEYEASSPAAIVGGAVGRAEGQSYQQQISKGYPLWTSEVCDAYSDAFDLKREEEEARSPIHWEDERPGRWKDQGLSALSRYHHDVAPHVQPHTVERSFEIALPHVEWTLRGYIDLESTIGRVLGIDDFKCRKASKGPVPAADAESDIQATAYLFAKRTEAESALFAGEQAKELREWAQRWLDGPRIFRYHNFVRPETGAARPADVRITQTSRTDEKLDSLLALLYRVAAEIDWRVESDVWTGAPPGAWWCAEKWCGYWNTCAFGGAHRPAVQSAPALVRRPTRDQVVAAVAATARKDGTTTADRVARHLGVSKRSAAGSLAALMRQEILARKSKAKNGKPLKHFAYSVLDDGTLSRDLQRSLTAANGGQQTLTPTT